MIRIATLPVQQPGTIRLMAKNQDWSELQERLKTLQQGRLLARIHVDTSHDVTVLTFSEKDAQTILSIAGLRY